MASHRIRLQPCTTERLVLSELAPEDDAFILQVLTDPPFVAFVGDRGVRDLATARRWLQEGPLRSYAEHGWGLWKVALRDGGTPIGICGLVQRPALRAPDLGYALLAPHAGQGFASEAAAAVMRLAVAVYDLEEVLAVVKPRHEVSIKVLRKLGFEHVGEVVLTAAGEAVAVFCSRLQRPPVLARLGRTRTMAP